MNNDNLPQINIFLKIKQCFLGLFKKDKNSKNEAINTIENEELLDSNNFMKNIKLNNNETILKLQRKLKSKQIEISNLTDEELEKMIKLYQKQIIEKKDKLKYYRMKIYQNN